jgi:hypothetical protein
MERGIVPDCQNENLATLVNCAKFLATKPLKINQLFLSENALKFTYSNLGFQNFLRSKWKEMEGREEWKRDEEGRGWGCGGREGKAKGKGMDEKTKEEGGEKGGRTGKRNLDPEFPERSTPLNGTMHLPAHALLRPITLLSSVDIAFDLATHS